MLKFSIVTVCLNPGEALKYTLESIEKQTYKNFEVIIKDGGSTDGSLKDIPGDERFTLCTEPDKSIYDAMNIAVKKAGGDFIIFMNCGDRFHSDDVLEKANEHLEEYIKLKSDAVTKTKTEKSAESIQNSVPSLIAYGDSFSVLSGNVVKAPGVITEKVCYNGIPCHQAMFYSKECFDIKQFDTAYKIRADYDHFLYMYFNKAADFEYMAFPVCDYEGGGYSESKKNRKRNNDEHREIVGKYIPKSHLFKYKARLILTLQPIREKLAKSKTFGAAYEALKRTFKK